MKRKLFRYLIVVSVCLVVAGLAVARLSRRDDPSFNGRRLSASVYDLLQPNSPTYFVSSNAVVTLNENAFSKERTLVSRKARGAEPPQSLAGAPVPRGQPGPRSARAQAARFPWRDDSTLRGPRHGQIPVA